MNQNLQLRPTSESGESGNVIAFILVAIVLIGIVTAAIRGGGNEGSSIDKENVVIKTSQILQYGSQLERGVSYIMQNGASEGDIRFAHANGHSDYGDINVGTTIQMFHRDGGGAAYKRPFADINDGSIWEFYGHTAFPLVGTTSADLIAVLPNVSQAICNKINEMSGYDPTIDPEDNGASGGSSCVHGGAAERFNDSTQYSGSPNLVEDATFSVKPAMRGCVKCSDDSLHFYQVILSR